MQTSELFNIHKNNVIYQARYSMYGKQNKLFP